MSHSTVRPFISEEFPSISVAFFFEGFNQVSFREDGSWSSGSGLEGVYLLDNVHQMHLFG
jgi:hypothetical protein